MSETEAMFAVGYDPIHGGDISDQKMAFIGLMLDAAETGRPVILPNFRVADSITGLANAWAFGSVFEHAPIMDFCARHAIRVERADGALASGAVLERGYERFFWKTYGVLDGMPGNPAGWQARFVVDLLRSLRPQMRSTYLRWAIGQHVAQQDPDFLVAQFRIEADWKKHCEDNLSRHCPDSEQNYLTAEAILGKIRRVHDKAKLLYVVCDETGLPMTPAEMKTLAKDKFDLQLTFKSDYLSVFEQAMLSRLHLWLLDFEFATFSRNFIGNSRSTFSCLATLERYCREGADVKDHTIYNAPGPSVRRRTDNGCYWSAEEATRPNYLP